MKPETSQAEQHSSIENQEVQEQIEGLISAPLPARLLAALIDYLVLNALLFGSAHLFDYSDWQFVIPLICGALYLGVGNSEVTRGQTLGKKAFGLRVISLSEKKNDFEKQHSAYLSLSRSVTRYLLSFGALILLAEVPPLIYRIQAVEQAVWIMELHMLCAMAVFTTLIALAVAHPLHRSFHDLFTHSLVVRGTPQSGQRILLPSHSQRVSSLRIALPLVLALLLAFGLWRIAALHSPASAAIMKYRYAIEARFPFRLLSVTESAESMEIQGLVLNTDKEEAKKISLQVGDFLSERLKTQSLESSKSQTKQLVFSVFSPDDPAMSQQQIQYPISE